MKNECYVLVDYNSKQIIDHLKPLPENWNNILGLPRYNDEKLIDLTWAGHPGLGWIKVSSPELSKFKYSSEWLEINKNNLKESISQERIQIQDEVLTYKGNYIVPDEKTKINLIIKKISGKDNFYWKFINSYQLISNQDVNSMLDLLDNYTQQCYNEEARLFSIIDNIKNIDDLISIKLSPNWPDTVLA